jgi:hypothetical protein
LIRLLPRVVVCYVLGIGLCAAQARDVSGRVINRKTNEPIAYANIGIPGTPYGTISDPDGSFLLRLPSDHEQDSIIFSALGFARIKFVATFFSGPGKVVAMDEVATRLKEVIVTNKPPEFFEMGNNRFNGGVLETDTAYAGGATSLLISPTSDDAKRGFSYPAYVEKAKLRILKNNLGEMKFRVRLNDVAQDGTPGKDFLEESIVVTSGMRKGWLEFDLSTTGIVVDKPFFVTFEQILDRQDRAFIATGFHEFMIKHPDKIRYDTVVVDGKKEVSQKLGAIGLDLPGTFICISSKVKVSDRSTSYQRDTSFSEWKKVNGIISAVVSLRPLKE